MEDGRHGRVRQRAAWPYVAAVSLLLIAAVALLTAFEGPAGSLEKGRAAFLRGDYAAALDLLLPYAETGEPDAQNRLGIMYELGRGVAADPGQAALWYRRAAAQGLYKAQYNLARLYGRGDGVPRDHAEAARWMRRAAEQGMAKAQDAIGGMYLNGVGLPGDDAEAVEWFRRAAEQGDAQAQAGLGFCYAHGRGVPRDRATAIDWFRRSARQGNAYARNTLRHMGAGERPWISRVLREVERALILDK